MEIIYVLIPIAMIFVAIAVMVFLGGEIRTI